MEPYMRAVTGPSASTTSDQKKPKIERSSRKGARRRKAAPLMRRAGDRGTVTLTLKRRGGAEGWIEVRVLGRRERFYVKHADWVGDIVLKILEGGYWVEEDPS